MHIQCLCDRCSGCNRLRRLTGRCNKGRCSKGDSLCNRTRGNSTRHALFSFNPTPYISTAAPRVLTLVAPTLAPPHSLLSLMNRQPPARIPLRLVGVTILSGSYIGVLYSMGRLGVESSVLRRVIWKSRFSPVSLGSQVPCAHMHHVKSRIYWELQRDRCDALTIHDGFP
jgi:hypothetical protein